MNELTEEKFKEFQKTYSEISKKAFAMLKKYCEIKGDRNEEFFDSITEIEEDSITLEGYWYDEHYSIQIPIKFILDSQAFDKFYQDYREKEDLKIKNALKRLANKQK